MLPLDTRNSYKPFFLDAEININDSQISQFPIYSLQADCRYENSLQQEQNIQTPI